MYKSDKLFYTVELVLASLIVIATVICGVAFLVEMQRGVTPTWKDFWGMWVGVACCSFSLLINSLLMLKERKNTDEECNSNN